MRIRHATIEDADSIRAMLTEHFKAERECGSRVQVGEPTIREAMALVGETLSQRYPGAVLIAEEGEEPIGLAALWCQESKGHDFARFAVPWVQYVRQASGAEGIAADLLQYVERVAMQLGCDAVRGSALLGTRAQMLYQSAGYAPAEVVFEKRLN